EVDEDEELEEIEEEAQDLEELQEEDPIEELDEDIELVDEDEIIAYLFFGQILASEESIDRQWLRAKANLEWYKDQDSLEILFKKLNILDYQKIKACAVILKACSAYIWLDGMVKKASLSDIQRVNAYIETNYTKDITLDSMVDALAMSKTKLCSLAKNQDTTIMKMVRNKRIKSAKRFLEKTEYPISEIAEMVGINDYNYFAKVFKAVERITPRDYRKQIKKEHDYSV
ncbi:MAG: helix-turn-helix domain-containing protein, partial [Clostridiales bacterium]|nr:helix-turn-helix domain-containing protein [Clostridiales bacterium]